MAWKYLSNSSLTFSKRRQCVLDISPNLYPLFRNTRSVSIASGYQHVFLVANPWLIAPLTISLLDSSRVLPKRPKLCRLRAIHAMFLSGFFDRSCPL